MIKNYRNKDWLYDQYFNQNKSCRQIAIEFGYKPVTVWKWFHTFGFIARPNGRELVGKKPHNYRGGHWNGKYLEVFVDKKKVLVHRKVMEESLGRKLGPLETVHHINGDQTDNRIENLKLFRSPGVHLRDGHHKVYGKVV